MKYCAPLSFGLSLELPQCHRDVYSVPVSLQATEDRRHLVVSFTCLLIFEVMVEVSAETTRLLEAYQRIRVVCEMFDQPQWFVGFLLVQLQGFPTSALWNGPGHDI